MRNRRDGNKYLSHRRRCVAAILSVYEWVIAKDGYILRISGKILERQWNS